MSSLVRLNVGGSLFEVEADLLQSKSEYFRVLLSGRFREQPDQTLRIERDPLTFIKVLSYLRGQFIADDNLNEELEFFAIDSASKDKPPAIKSLPYEYAFIVTPRLSIGDFVLQRWDSFPLRDDRELRSLRLYWKYQDHVQLTMVYSWSPHDDDDAQYNYNVLRDHNKITVSKERRQFRKQLQRDTGIGIMDLPLPQVIPGKKYQIEYQSNLPFSIYAEYKTSALPYTLPQHSCFVTKFGNRRDAIQIRPDCSGHEIYISTTRCLENLTYITRGVRFSIPLVFILDQMNERGIPIPQLTNDSEKRRYIYKLPARFDGKVCYISDLTLTFLSLNESQSRADSKLKIIIVR